MNPNIPKMPVMALPTREGITDQQVGVLLDILGTLHGFLTLPLREQPEGHPEMDGGVVSAASATFIRVTAKLDDLLSDDARWNLAETKTLHASLMQTQELQQTFLATQTESVREVQRPSFQLRPELITSEGKYYAVYGDINTPNYLVGEGSTPDGAMRDFDAAFLKAPEEQIRLLPAAPEPIPEPVPETPVTYKPKRKKY